MPQVRCKSCSNAFYAKPSSLKEGNGKYCSLACYKDARPKGKEVPCDICGKLSYKQKRDLGRSKSGKFFCGKSCQTRWRNQLYVGDKHKNFTTGESSYRAVMERAHILKACRLCKTQDFRVLAVHHIDKNRRNNSPENLAWLCHNCHFLVHHYQGDREKFMAAMV